MAGIQRRLAFSGLSVFVGFIRVFVGFTGFGVKGFFGLRAFVGFIWVFVGLRASLGFRVCRVCLYGFSWACRMGSRV